MCDNNDTITLINRQKALTSSALVLSDIDNLRGKSHRVLDIIAPHAEADSIYVYRLEEDDTYRVVASWFVEHNSNCINEQIPVPKSSIDKKFMERMLSETVLPDVHRVYTGFPVLSKAGIASARMYPMIALGDVMGIIILTSGDARGWDLLCSEWLESISAMLTASIRRTIANELLSRELVLRDKVYPIIAHDIRSYIGSIKMMIEIVNHEVLDESGRNSMLFMIEQTTEESFMLLDNMLKWSRGRMSRVEPEKDMVDINTLISTTVAMARQLAAQKGVGIDLMMPEKVINFECDQEMIRTVIRNLLSNAIKFSYVGGRVVVKLSESSGVLTISVADSGKGMTPDQVRKLMDDNEHFSTYGTSGEKGSGLGFVLCRQFVKMHSGVIEVDSVEGHGSTFTVSLPY